MNLVVVPLVRNWRHDVAWAADHHHFGLTAAYATDSGLVRRGKVL